MLLLLDRPVDTEKWPPILLDDGPITAEVESEGIRVTVMGWVSQGVSLPPDSTHVVLAFANVYVEHQSLNGSPLTIGLQFAICRC